jgi:hypothetical protein
MMAYESAFGGVSGVNPQAKGDYTQYIDAAFKNWQQMNEPGLEQQRQQWEQSMINRGIPVGQQGYNDAWQQLAQNQDRARADAAFGAMGFGLGVQQQDYAQDLGRSQLANALLRSQWGDETNRYNIDVNKDLGYARLGEDSRQFDQGLGFKYAGLGEDARQFDAGQDYDYWERGNYYDYLGDRAQQSDLQWLTEFDRDIWNDQTDLYQWADRLGQLLLTPFNPNLPNVGAALTRNNLANLAIFDDQYQRYGDWWGNLGTALGEIDWDQVLNAGGG